MMKKISIEKPRQYDICFAEDFSELKESINAVSSKGRKALIITDLSVAPLYLDEVMAECEPCFLKVLSFVIEAGERSKTLKSAETIIKFMIENGFNRDDMIIALGGGVVGDLSGFCAAVYMRGIDFIQIPTTLLSQVDSSIGGKVAVDMEAYKNMIGAFHSPVLVYENSACLKTLPKDQFLSGMGEVIKSAFLGDKELWDFLLESFKDGNITDVDNEILVHMLCNTCAVKKKVVDEDPFDTGRRAVLNFGHTIGHGIEKCSDFALSHGACVALGTICALYISMKRGYISQSEYSTAYSFMQKLGFDLNVGGLEGISIASITDAISKDKKNGLTGLKFILIDKIGNAVIKTDVTNDEIIEALSVIGIEH